MNIVNPQKIYQSGTATTINALNVRAQPATSADIVSMAQKGFQVSYDGYSTDGESISGNSKWYFTHDGYWFWDGGVTNIQEGRYQAGNNWAIVGYRVNELWNQSKGEGVKVAVLDSGLIADQADFLRKTNIVYYNAIDDSTNCNAGHGTECAGILCSDKGVAPEVDLIVINVTDSNGINTSGILKGLVKAVELGADIISMSFTIANDANFNAIHQAIQEAYQKNIVIVAAAGDSGSLSFPVDNYPASFPECLSIGGVDQNGIRSRASSMSNYLDLMGPGEGIPSLIDPNNTLNGTSFSTPFVAGIIAILLSIVKKNNKNLSLLALQDILKRSTNINITGNQYTKIGYGWGIIVPTQALTLIQNYLNNVPGAS
jgi:subtilisin family serine protease